MLTYKIKIADDLERKGFNTYKAKTTGLLSQEPKKGKGEQKYCELSIREKLLNI